MLVLSRRPGEKLYLGADIAITLIEIAGNRVRLGIEAPDQVAVLRAELRDSPDFASGSVLPVQRTPCCHPPDRSPAVRETCP
jgi:carbon storage regulator